MIGKYALETARKMGVAEAVAAGDRARAGPADLGRRRPATRPSASTWRRSTRRRPSAARTWIRPRTSPRCRRWCWTPSGQAGGKSGVVIFGGGAPKNFLLQTEPQLQEILGVSERGHDYFIQITDARPDTGGLSGATPAEAVSWGKIDPDLLPDTVVCLRRLDDGDAADGVVRARALQAAQAAPPVQAPEGDGGGAARRVPQVGSVQALLARRGRRGAARRAPAESQPPAASPLSGKPRRRTRARPSSAVDRPVDWV